MNSHCFHSTAALHSPSQCTALGGWDGSQALLWLHCKAHRNVSGRQGGELHTVGAQELGRGRQGFETYWPACIPCPSVSDVRRMPVRHSPSSGAALLFSSGGLWFRPWPRWWLSLGPSAVHPSCKAKHWALEQHGHCLSPVLTWLREGAAALWHHPLAYRALSCKPARSSPWSLCSGLRGAS